MTDKMSEAVVRAGAFCALVAATLLVGMALLGAAAGDAFSTLTLPEQPSRYGELLRPAASALVRVLALDNLFLIAYTGAFAGAAALVWSKARVFAAIGLGFALLTALLDLTENALAIHVLRMVLADLPVPAAYVAWLSGLGQVKYAGAGLALAFFGLAVLIVRPASRRLTLGVAATYFLFPVANALAVVDPAYGLLVVAWMLIALLVSAALLWAATGREAGRSPEVERYSVYGKRDEDQGSG